MKKLIYLFFVVSAVYLASCKRDASVAPESKTPASTTAVTPAGGSLNPRNAASTDTIVNVTGYIRLEFKDSIHMDNIVIYFTPTASASFVPGEDAARFGGFSSESLSSISSDGIPLSVNELPLK